MAKKVTSRKGLFGTTTHYDERGRKIGESSPSFFGSITTRFKDKK